MKKNVIGLAIGILIMILLLYGIGLENIIDLFLKIKIEYFLIACFFYIFVEIIASLMVRVVIKAKLKDILSSHMCGMFLSNATPGRVGYYYTAYSLSKKSEYSTSENIGSLTLLQGISFFVKVFLCMAAVLYFSSFMISSVMNYFILISLLPLLFFVGIILALYTKILNKILKKITILSALEKYVGMMQNSVKKLNKQKVVIIMLLNLVGWFIAGFQWMFVAKALNVDIGLLTAMMFQPLLTTIMFIPITPSGLGVAESGSALLFKIIGFSSIVGVSFLLLERLSIIVVDAFGLIDLKNSKIKLEKIKSKT